MLAIRDDPLIYMVNSKYFLSRQLTFGVADDFPKEVDEIRKELYPVLKKTKRDHKTAFFNVEKLIIDKTVYRGPERKNFTLYGRIMDNI